MRCPFPRREYRLRAGRARVAFAFLDKNVGYFRPLALAVSRPRLGRAALDLFLEAMRSFFIPQFANVVFRRRSVVSVDHQLDAEIPFDPRYAGKYLEFVKLWMGSIYKLWKLYGENAICDICRYVDSIRSLYRDAGSVYRRVHTTTERPQANPNLRFALIHALDPHLNCVPSLHVLIVLANWKLAEAFVGRRAASGADSDALEKAASNLVASLRDEALAITETVLFVKQHSINCIGASLYYLASRFPGFSDRDAREVVRDLFTVQGSDLAAIGEIRAEILGIYESLRADLAERPGLGWRAPLLDFIDVCGAGGPDFSGRSSAS